MTSSTRGIIFIGTRSGKLLGIGLVLIAVSEIVYVGLCLIEDRRRR